MCRILAARGLSLRAALVVFVSLCVTLILRGICHEMLSRDGFLGPSLRVPSPPLPSPLPGAPAPALCSSLGHTSCELAFARPRPRTRPFAALPPLLAEFGVQVSILHQFIAAPLPVAQTSLLAGRLSVKPGRKHQAPAAFSSDKPMLQASGSYLAMTQKYRALVNRNHVDSEQTACLASGGLGRGSRGRGEAFKTPSGSCSASSFSSFHCACSLHCDILSHKVPALHLWFSIKASASLLEPVDVSGTEARPDTTPLIPSTNDSTIAAAGPGVAALEQI